jgi:hypothetical protein
MYSVYKESKLALGLSLLMGSITITAHASECSTLQFTASEVNGINYVTNLKHNNGLLLESEMLKFKDTLRSMKEDRNNALFRSKKETINGSTKYYLAEGDHSLTVEMWKKNDLKRGLKETLYSSADVLGIAAKPEKVSTYKMVTENNLAYQVSIALDGELDIKSTKKLCVLKTNHLLPAIVKTDKTVRSLKKLPIQLEKRLRVVMNKVINSGQPLGVINSVESEFFGAVKDNSYKGKEGHIRLLSVMPYSLAHNLGLLSGDVIISYGDMENSTLEETLLALEYKKHMEFEVLRSSTLVKLKMEYKPVVVPEVIYGVSESDLQKKIISPSEFNSETQFEINQLMLEVSNFYRKNNFKGTITLARDDTYNKEFGLVGTLIKNPNSGYVINVVDVLPFSSAKGIGLQRGDLIISVNNQIMETTNISNINKELRELIEGKEYFISIKRGNDYITLKEKYIPSEFSKFALHIDLDTEDKHYKNIIITENIRMEYVKELATQRQRDMFQTQRRDTGGDYLKRDNGENRLPPPPKKIGN